MNEVALTSIQSELKQIRSICFDGGMEDKEFYSLIACSAEEYNKATETDQAIDFAKSKTFFFEFLIDFVDSLYNLGPITSYLSKTEKELGHSLTVKEVIKLLENYKE